jgi:glutaredoxin
MAGFEGFSLYQYEGCPYCTRVEHFMAENGISLEIRNVYDRPEYLQELVAATGSRSVPCLRVEDPGGEVEWLHESADIIVFLRERLETV